MQSDFIQTPAFDIIRPEKQVSPVIVNSPHSGRYYPTRFLAASNLSPHMLRQSEDAYVDDLYAAAPLLGMPLLRANFPRAYLDLNRAPYELDASMFDEPLPDHFQTNTPRVAAGLGTIARIVSEGNEIYRGKLSLADGAMRIRDIYFPYHEALRNLIQQTHMQFGYAIVLDCHSMPKPFRTGGSSSADIVLGDRFGTTCSARVTDTAEEFFSAAGLVVHRNRPYAGGYITTTYGTPKSDVHCLQVEISRHLYMNEGTLAPNRGFKTIQKLSTHFLAEIAGINSDLKSKA